jgi:hypothetical protein
VKIRTLDKDKDKDSKSLTLKSNNNTIVEHPVVRKSKHFRRVFSPGPSKLVKIHPLFFPRPFLAGKVNNSRNYVNRIMSAKPRRTHRPKLRDCFSSLSQVKRVKNKDDIKNIRKIKRIKSKYFDPYFVTLCDFSKTLLL